MSWRGINTENSDIRGSYLKGCKPPFWISANLSDTFKTYMKQDKQSSCVTITRKEKDGTQPTIPYMVYLIKTDMSLSENTDAFALLSAKLKGQILFQGVPDATKIGIYHAATIENSESKNFLTSASHFFL